MQIDRTLGGSGVGVGMSVGVGAMVGITSTVEASLSSSEIIGWDTQAVKVPIIMAATM